MKTRIQGFDKLAPLLVAILLAGCALSSEAAGDPAKYQAMSCNDLNAEIGKTAVAISDAAVRRAKISQVNLPFWVPGGAKATTALKNRRAAQIERLQAKQDALEAVRKQRCK